MHDVKRDLHRAAGGFPAPRFDVETVWRRKGHRETLHRVGTITTVLVIVGASASVLWNAFGSDPRQQGDATSIPMRSNGVIWFTEGEIGGRIEGIRMGSVQPDGTDRRTLIDGIPDPHGEAISPDGSTIVFSRDPAATPDGDYGIWSMRADGSSLTQLTPSQGKDGGASWSPDGTRILFIRYLGGRPGDPTSGVFSMSADGSDLTALSRDEQTHYAIAAWSPDGSRILVLTYAPGADNGYVLSVMNQDGSGLREIYRGPCGSPQWSPAGDAILFQTGGSLQLISADGADRHSVLDGLDGDVVFGWSPDGTRILYTRPVSPEDGEELHVRDIAGTTDVVVVEGLEWRYPQPTWSPDGTRIAFVRGGDIWTVGADGSGEQRITDTDRYEGVPLWAPRPPTAHSRP